jgi:hypothetical protein
MLILRVALSAPRELREVEWRRVRALHKDMLYLMLRWLWPHFASLSPALPGLAGIVVFWGELMGKLDELLLTN